MARKLCDLLEKDVYDKRGFILEGGSIHVDGEGTCMVTESRLLSKGRNPEMTREQIEDTLKQYLGVSKILWLSCGIYHDEANEYVNNICAFIKPSEVVLAWTDDTEDVQYNMSKACLDHLNGEMDAKGRKITVHKLFYPTAIGSEPSIECDSMPHWRRCMQGHAAANVIPVIAAKRIGEEKVLPTKNNNDQSSALVFYGSSFITDETGEILEDAGRTEEKVILRTFNLEAALELRFSWGLFRDRRPEMYDRITT